MREWLNLPHIGHPAALVRDAGSQRGGPDQRVFARRPPEYPAAMLPDAVPEADRVEPRRMAERHQCDDDACFSGLARLVQQSVPTQQAARNHQRRMRWIREMQKEN